MTDLKAGFILCVLVLTCQFPVVRFPTLPTATAPYHLHSTLWSYRFAPCAMLYARFALVCVNRRKSAVKYVFRTWLPLRLCARYLFFLLSPVVSGPAFAAYCHLPTVFLSG